MLTNLYQHVGNVRGQKLMQVGTDRNLAIVSYHAQFHIVTRFVMIVWYINLRVKYSKMFGHLTQKGSSVVQEPYDIS